MELKEKEEILFGGEFVQLGNVANSAPVTRPTADEPMPSEMPKATDATEAVDLTNEGTVGEPMPVVAAQQESPMKVKEQPRPEKAGPTAEEIAAAEKAKRGKRKLANASKTDEFRSGSRKSGTDIRFTRRR